MTRIVSRREALWSLESLCGDLGVPVPPVPAPVIVERVDVYPSGCAPGSLFAPVDETEADRRPPDEAPLIRNAFAHDAAVALTSRDGASYPPGAPVLRVDSIDSALRKLADAALRRFKGQLIGVTGSVAKTSTKEIIRHVLSFAGTCQSTSENYNGHLGLLAVIASTPASADFSVCEVSFALPEFHHKVNAAIRPSVGVVTNVGHSHEERMGSQRAILRAKLSLLGNMTGERAAVVGQSVVDLDRSSDNILPTLRIDRLATVGSDSTSTAFPKEIAAGPVSTSATVSVDGRLCRIFLPYPGVHLVTNALFALATANVLNLDTQSLADSFVNFQPPRRRMQRFRVNIRGSGRIIELIDDAYNAAPDSVRALLQMLAARRPARKVLVFGDMLELGQQTERLHLELVDDIRAAGIPMLITVGAMTRQVGAALRSSAEVVSFDTVEDAKKKIPGLLRSGDLVAVKASYGIGLRQVVEGLAGPVNRKRVNQYWMIENEAASSDAAEFSVPQPAD